VVVELQDPQDEVITPQTHALNQQRAYALAQERASTTSGAELERNPQTGELPFSELTTAGTVRRPSGSAFVNRRLAYNAVFKRWGVDFEATSNQQIPCDFAPSAGLQCLSRQGSWESIRQLDLPVVMELQDTDAGSYHVALVGLQASDVQLQVANQRLATSEQSLLESWSGSYVVLWQTPPGYYGSLRNGQSHETVGWLRQQLSGLTRQSLASATPNYFDDGLTQAVLEFQQAEGLLTDGVVGPDTWIKLAERLDLPQPSLAG
jgi:general secretion pathway protein A